MALLLGIDLGTSYFKVGLFDAAGALRGLGRVAVEKDVPLVGRSEVPVPRFWALLRRGLTEALAQAGAEATEIAAVSYSSQANSFVLLDDGDEPLTPLVLWNDVRAEPMDARLAEFARGGEFARRVGFTEWSGGFAPAKWRWFQANAPDLWRWTRSVMTMADYLTYALTGRRVGDASTAAFLGLYDLTARDWWAEALAASGVDAAQLSTPLTPGAPAGPTSPRATELLGVPAGVAFAVGGLDHHVAALGSGLGTLADVSLSTGTVLAAMTLVPGVEARAGCFHGPDFDGVRYYRLAFDPEGAGQLEDYQRCCASEFTLEELLALAESGRGTGLDSGDAAGHGAAIRQLMEKIAETQRGLIAQVTGGARASRIVATGGGSRSALWLQIQADCFGVPIMTPATPERACLGAAMLGSVAIGWHRTLAEATGAMLTVGRLFEPTTGRP